MSIQDSLDEFRHFLCSQLFLELLCGNSSGIPREIGIQEDQGEVDGVHLVCGEFEEASHVFDVHVLQELKILGVTQKVRNIAGPAPDNLVRTIHLDRAQTLAIDEQGYTSLA